MWRIESQLDEAGAAYDRRAAVYDRLVRSRTYNRIAWSTAPGDYAEFAAAAIASADGPLLEAAAGSAAATAELHARSQRPTVLVDLSRPMLERAARRIVAAGDGDEQEVPAHIRLVQADVLALPFPGHEFNTVLGLGLTHLFGDLPALVAALRSQLLPGGQVHLAGLVTETARGRRYLEILHRAGEVAAPRTAEELHGALGRPATSARGAAWPTRCCLVADLAGQSGSARSSSSVAGNDKRDARWHASSVRATDRGVGSSRCRP